MATQQEVIDDIRAVIIANGNNEITADILRPILELITNFVIDMTGDLADLNLSGSASLPENLVDAINRTIQIVNEIAANGASPDSFKGTYADLPALQLAHPTASFGDYAIVLNDGVDDGFFEYDWSDDTTEWVKVDGVSVGNVLMKIFSSSFSGATALKFNFDDEDLLVSELVGGGISISVRKYYDFAMSDESSDIETGNAFHTKLMRKLNRCTRFDFSVKTAPVGAPVEIDVKKNGVSIFTTRPVIDAGTYSTVDSVVTPVLISPGVAGFVTFAKGDTLDVEILQRGTTTIAQGIKGQITHN